MAWSRVQSRVVDVTTRNRVIRLPFNPATVGNGLIVEYEPGVPVPDTWQLWGFYGLGISLDSQEVHYPGSEGQLSSYTGGEAYNPVDLAPILSASGLGAVRDSQYVWAVVRSYLPDGELSLRVNT